MAVYPYQLQTLDAVTQHAEAAEAALREIEHQRIQREVSARVAREEAMTATRLREQSAARDAEIEETRRGSWLRYLTAPERIMPFAEAQFDPAYIENRTPASGWPADDAPENHTYRNADVLSLPDYDENSEPALVREAKARGIPV
jgi:hypothetical protein